MKERRKRLSPNERKDFILAAAMRVFIKNPDASLADVAKEAGVTRQLVSLYFPGGGVTPMHLELITRFGEQFSLLVEAAAGERPRNLKELKKSLPEVLTFFFDFAKSIEAPWIFAGEASSMLHEVGLKRVLLRGEIAQAWLQWMRHVVKDSDSVRLAMRIELRALDELLWLFVTGRIQRREAERVALAHLLATIEHTFPALRG